MARDNAGKRRGVTGLLVAIWLICGLAVTPQRAALAGDGTPAPALAVSQSMANPGGHVRVTGTHFPPATLFLINLRLNSKVKALGRIVTLRDGTLSLPATIPSFPFGQATVQAVLAHQSVVATTTLTVVPLYDDFTSDTVASGAWQLQQAPASETGYGIQSSRLNLTIAGPTVGDAISVTRHVALNSQDTIILTRIQSSLLNRCDFILGTILTGVYVSLAANNFILGDYAVSRNDNTQPFGAAPTPNTWYKLELVLNAMPFSATAYVYTSQGQLLYRSPSLVPRGIQYNDLDRVTITSRLTTFGNASSAYAIDWIYAGPQSLAPPINAS